MLWLPNARAMRERLAAGEPPVESAPVPVRVTVCGLPVALSLTLSVAVRVPVALGVNLALMVQLAPAASVDGLKGQLLVWAKLPLLVPVMAMLVIDRAALPEFERVTA